MRLFDPAAPGRPSDRPAGRPALIAHRGSGSGSPDGLRENSPDSLRSAVRRGYRWVELDVRRTSDDALVLSHDPTLPDGRFLVDVTAAEALAAGAHLLDEGLAALGDDVGVDIDLKTSLEDATRPAGRTTAALLAPHLAARAGSGRVLVTSFDPAALLQLRERVPEVALGLLTWKHFPLRKAIPAVRHLGLDAVVAHVPSFAANDVDPAPLHRAAEYSVGVAHDAGLDVVAWCPRGEQARSLAAAGVDAFVVNDADGVAAALGLDVAADDGDAGLP